MIGLSPTLPFFLCTRPVDMRKSFDGLCGEVRSFLGQDPASGAVFLFVNRTRDRLKFLFFDRHGFWIFYKRLEAGRFELPRQMDGTPGLRMPWEELVFMLEGVDLASVRRRRRFGMKDISSIC